MDEILSQLKIQIAGICWLKSSVFFQQWEWSVHEYLVDKNCIDKGWTFPTYNLMGKCKNNFFFYHLSSPTLSINTSGLHILTGKSMQKQRICHICFFFIEKSFPQNWLGQASLLSKYYLQTHPQEVFVCLQLIALKDSDKPYTRPCLSIICVGGNILNLSSLTHPLYMY